MHLQSFLPKRSPRPSSSERGTKPRPTRRAKARNAGCATLQEDCPSQKRLNFIPKKSRGPSMKPCRALFMSFPRVTLLFQQEKAPTARVQRSALLAAQAHGTSRPWRKIQIRIVPPTLGTRHWAGIKLLTGQPVGPSPKLKPPLGLGPHSNLPRPFPVGKAKYTRSPSMGQPASRTRRRGGPGPPGPPAR